MNDRTSFLFADPSFSEGVGRLADFSGALNNYNISRTPKAADRRAIRADWEVVGDDLREAGKQLRRGLSRKPGKRR